MLNGTAAERLCALPPTKVHFFATCHVCERCFASTAVRGQCETPPQCLEPSSVCSQQERQLGECLVVRAQKHSVDSWTKEQARLVEAFRSLRVAVAGDSMGRQSFTVLVSLLRGEDVVFDSGVGDTYAQLETPDGSVVDFLGMAHTKHVAGVHFPPEPLPQWGRLAARAFDDKTPRNSSFRVSYVRHECYSYRESSLQAAVQTGSFDLLLLHSPAYWPLLDMCGRWHNRTADIVHTLERPNNVVAQFWSQLAHDASLTRTKVVVVNAPTEKIGRYRTRFSNAGFEQGAQAHAALEAYERGVFVNLTRHSPHQWAFVDWASLMRQRNYAGVGLNETDWHYACGYQGMRGGKGPRDRFDYGHPPAYIMITPRGTPMDCFEDGNTALYRELVLPQLQRWTRSRAARGAEAPRVEVV